MRRGILYALIVVGVLVILLAAVPFLINANQFRPVIEEKLSSTLDREVRIGEIGLSILSGSLSAEDLSIADDPAFGKSPFLSARSLKVGIELKPLIFSRALRITRIVIEKPEVVILHRADGKWNFSSLASSGAANTSDAPGSAIAQGPDALIRRFELIDGRLTVGSENAARRVVYEKVQVEADDVSLTSQFRFRLSAALPEGGSLRLEGTAGPLHQGDASLSPVEATLSIDGLHLAETGFIDPASGIGGIMDLAGTVTSKGGQAHARGEAKLNRLRLVKGGEPAAVPVAVSFDSIYDLTRKSSSVKRGVLRAGAAVLNLTGDSRTVGDTTHLDMTLAGRDAPVKDLQALLPAAGVALPKSASLDRGTININLAITGPADRLVTSGEIGVFKAELAGFDMSSKLAALPSFSALKGQGGKTLVEKLTTRLKVSPDGIQATDLEMIVPAVGELKGSGTIAPDTTMNFKMSATLASAGIIGGTIARLTGRAGRDTRIPFLVRGKTSDPKFLPDVRGMVEEVVPSDLGSTIKGLFSKPKK